MAAVIEISKKNTGLQYVENTPSTSKVGVRAQNVRDIENYNHAIRISQTEVMRMYPYTLCSRDRPGLAIEATALFDR